MSDGTSTPYEPRGSARDLILSRDPAVVISAAAGTGKSLAALYKVHARSARIPGMQSIILRQTHASLTASTLRTFEMSVVGEALTTGHVTWFGGSARQPPAYRYANGSLVMVGGLDQPGKLLGTEPDFIFVDEATQISVTAFETLASRLRGNAPTYKQIMLATNPDHPEHWIMKMVREGRLRMIHGSHKDNPRFVNRDGTLTDDGELYLGRLSTLTGVRRARYYEGRWVSAEGQVYDAWSDAVHLIDSFDVPADWRTVWSWDQGFNNPQVFQRWAVDGDGRVYLTHEMSVRQRLVEDFARDILDLRERHGWSWPEAFVADHDGSDRAAMERHLGFPTIKARKAVGPGIQAVANRLIVQKDGKPRLFVFRDALVSRDPLAATDGRPRGFAAEVGGYVWQTIRGSDGVPKEEPVKINDHSADATRYMCMYLDGAPPARVGNPARASGRATGSAGSWSRPVGR